MARSIQNINLYFRKPAVGYKWIPGDRQLIHFFRKVLGLNKVGGIERVFVNLCKGFDQLKISYSINKKISKIQPGEAVVVLGIGKEGLQGYSQPNPVIAGIGLMTHPNEWPGLFDEYPVVRYLQHSDWTNDIYARYFGQEHCEIWPAGIDTDHWQPVEDIKKSNDVLIYNKIMWDKDETEKVLKEPIIETLDKIGLSHKEIVYSQYKSAEYHALLQQSRAMIFLCEHESQGFACCEALSMNVPVFAWDQGYWLDPNRFKWNDPVVPATSVPFFDERCGMTFKDIDGFEQNIAAFWQGVEQGEFSPRDYVLESLTLEKSAERMLAIIEEVYK